MRRGEKVPAAGQAVADGFGQLQLSAQDVQRSDLVADRTGLAAVRARLELPQSGRTLLQQGFQSALGQAAGGGAGHFLQGSEVQIRPGAVAATGTAGDNFTPLVGQFT